MAALFEQADRSDDYDWTSELWRAVISGLNSYDQESMRNHRLKFLLSNLSKDPQ